MTEKEMPGDRRVLVIGLSPVKNEEVVGSLRKLGVNAVGCTEPDTAAEQYDARNFTVIAFGRAALGPRVDRLKQAFSHQDPNVRFVDAFGPIAVAQVSAALQRHPQTPVLVDSVVFCASRHGGRVTAIVLTACHVTVTLYAHPVAGTLERHRLLDADVSEGLMTCTLPEDRLLTAYSLVVIANDKEFHHLPFL